MSIIREIQYWRKRVGLLPILLSNENSSEFLLLNGGPGDFCISTSIDEIESPDYYNSKAWSSSTRNFIAFEKDNVLVFNWKKEKVEKILLSRISDNSNLFYDYLLTHSQPSELDAVPFIIDVFRRLRNYTNEKVNPSEALNLLFTLLISIDEDPAKIDHEKWGLDSRQLPQNFDNYVDQIRQGVLNFKPNLDLLLRHSAGNIFQEAQKEIILFDSQLDIFGSYSNNLISNEIRYSSVHYTPSFLSRTIVEQALSKFEFTKSNEISIFDPACGSGEFLVEVLKQLRSNGYRGKVILEAWDSSQTALKTTSFLLLYEQRKVWADQLKFSTKIVKDSLQETWDKYDLILMNPPFVSWELLNDKEKRDAVCNSLGRTFIGKPNQSSAFFYRALHALKPNGVLGCVLPSSILTLDAYKKLRNEAQDLINIDSIGKLGNFVFQDALTDISFFIGSNKENKNPPNLVWTRNQKGVFHKALREYRIITSSNQSKVDKEDFCIYQPRQFPIIPDTWKLISLRENNLLDQLKLLVLDRKLTTIGKLFSVKQGIRQGAKDIFKISKSDYNNLPNSEKGLFRPVVDNAAFDCGKLHPNHYIWYPYSESGMIFENEDSLKSEAGFFYNNVLLPNRDQLLNRKGISEWWGHTRPRNWQYDLCSKIVSAEFGNSNSFSFDMNGSFAVERGYAWIPKYNMTIQDNYFYLAIFSSSFFDKLLSIYSKQLAGGNWYDLSKKYVDNIPIIKISREKEEVDDDIALGRETPIYNSLVEFGKQISHGELQIKTQLNELVTKFLYKVQ